MNTNVMRKAGAAILATAIVTTMMPMVSGSVDASTKRPAKVTGVKCSVTRTTTKNTAKLTWKKAKRAKRYKVYMRKAGAKHYKLIALTKKTSYSKKISKTSYFKIKGYNGKTGTASKTVKAKYKLKSASTSTTTDTTTLHKSAGTDTTTASSEPLATLSNGLEIYDGKTYSMSEMGLPLGNRSIKADMVIDGDVDGDYSMTSVFGHDADTGAYLNVSTSNTNFSKSIRFMEYDALSTYDSDYNVDTSKKWQEDYFEIRGNGDNSSVITVKDSDITIYETIDGTEPTPDNYYKKFTKADGTSSGYAWGYYTNGYDWIRAYKDGEVVYESLSRLVSWK
ncbi:MAG: hypothetical protein ACOYJJ_03800 [Anaerovoracaceae bacterium]